MFRPNPAIIRFSFERLSAFIKSMRFCNNGEISSSVGLIITIIEAVAGEERGGFCNVGIPHRTAATENRHLRGHYNPSQHNTRITEPLPLLPSYCLNNINRLTPNDPYMGRTAPLTSKRCILYIYSTNTGTE